MLRTLTILHEFTNRHSHFVRAAFCSFMLAPLKRTHPSMQVFRLHSFCDRTYALKRGTAKAVPLKVTLYLDDITADYTISDRNRIRKNRRAENRMKNMLT